MRTRHGKTRTTGVLTLVLALVLAACGSDSPGDEASPDDETASVGEAGASDPGADDPVGDTDSTTDSTADGTDTTAAGAAPAADGEVVCSLVDGGSKFDLTFTHGGSEAATYKGEVTFEPATNEAVPVSIEYVAPGEAVQERYFSTGGLDSDITECSAEAVVAEEGPVPEVGASDVSTCDDIRLSSINTFAYDITVTNSSEQVPAFYSMRVGVYDPNGVRRLTRLVLADYDNGATHDVAPGATVTETDETLIIPFEEDWSCEVISVDKQTGAEFFRAEGGTTTGSLSSDVGFEVGSAVLTEDALVLLSTASERIATHTGEVCVEGFADSVGSDDDNLALSQERADAVADFLRDSGTTAQIEAVGRGESEATVDDVDDPTLRRVDITLAACAE